MEHVHARNELGERLASLTSAAAASLAQLDELAAIWGDEGVFRRCRDRLRAALKSEAIDAA